MRAKHFCGMVSKCRNPLLVLQRVNICVLLALAALAAHGACPCRSAIAQQEHLERLMQEAPAVALKLIKVFLEQGAPQKRHAPKQDGGELKRLKKE